MDQVDISHLLRAIDDDNFNLVEGLVTRYKLNDVSEVRNHESDATFVLLGKERFSIHRWNALQFAIKAKSLKSVKYFCEKLNIHITSALRAPSIDEYCSVVESRPEEAECFPLLIALNNRDFKMLEYLWNNLAYIWDNFHLLYFVEQMGKYDYQDGIKFVMESEKANQIFLGCQMRDQISFVHNLVSISSKKMQLASKNTIKQLLCTKGYATAFVIYLLTTKDYQSKLTENSQYVLACLEKLEF